MSTEHTSEDVFSILNLYGKTYDSEETEVFYRDLNLLQVIDKLSEKWGRSIRKYFMYLPEDRQEEAYRRSVYGDIRKETVYGALIRYTENLAETERLRGKKENASNPLQKAIWRIHEEESFCNTYEELARELSGVELDSEGMREFLRILTEYLGSETYRRMREQTAQILRELRAIRFIVTYDKDRISVALGEVPGAGAYEEWLDREAGAQDTQLVNPFNSDSAITEFEDACMGTLRKRRPEFFRALQKASEESAEYTMPVFQLFEQEVLYYLAYCSLQRDMEKAGFAFSTPETFERDSAAQRHRRMEAAGLYDLALALATLRDGRTVIPNDFYYDEGDRIFVLTGPNQGGKTTFARSLGQLVYFTKMGLDVPARSACVPYFPAIQTHFSVEESVETGRGKLMDELVRLAPMMEDHRRGSFVVINELFTTAANYDAQIMGKRVLEHFIGLDCMGIYVTHLKELAENRDGVVSLRAMLNDRGVQTFEIRRGEAEDTVCAANQVNKYRLTYKQLKERL